MRRDPYRQELLIDGLERLGFAGGDAHRMAEALDGFSTPELGDVFDVVANVATGGAYGAARAVASGDAASAAQLISDPAGYLLSQNADWLWDKALKPIMKKVLGDGVGGKAVDVLELMLGAGDRAQEYLLWTMQTSLELVQVIVRGAANRDADYIMHEVGVALSKSFLLAPGIDDVLVVLAVVQSGSNSASARRKVRAQLTQAAEKDPMFGVNVIMWAISLFPWPTIPARIAADPGKFAADVLTLLRKVVLETIRESMKLDDATIKVVDKIYGIVLMALTKVQDFPASMTAFGVAQGKATSLWNELLAALTHFDFAEVPRCFWRIVDALRYAASNVNVPAGSRVLASAADLRAIEGKLAAEVKRREATEAELVQSRKREMEAERRASTLAEQQRLADVNKYGSALTAAMGGSGTAPTSKTKQQSNARLLIPAAITAMIVAVMYWRTR